MAEPARTEPVAQPALSVEGLEVRYAGVPAVRGISFEIGRGEIVGLIGPNGAGKTSTLHAIMGIARPSGGSIRVAGREISGIAPERIVRAGVALVPEGRRIYADMSVDENIRLGIVGRRRREGLAHDLTWIHELFPVLGEARKRRAGVLSGGQQQQLAIARALVAHPDVLLLDEPSLGLAPLVVDAVFDALRKIRQRGIATLLVEQRAQRTAAFANRTHVLSQGTIRTTLLPQDADDTERMVAAYFGS